MAKLHRKKIDAGPLSKRTTAGLWDALLPATGPLSLHDGARVDAATALDEWEAEGGAPAFAPQAREPAAVLRPPFDRLLLERLGAALLAEWSHLPVPLQRAVYESAVGGGMSSNRTGLRREMARFLHDHQHHAQHVAVSMTAPVLRGPGIAL
jgi:hypothetical protein